MANAVIYARYSSAGQREESIEDQVRVCRQAAERDGLSVARLYHDDATTGRSAEGRDGFLRMVADAGSGLFDVVYVYKLDRFARNRYDAAVYKAKLRRCGVELRSATEAVGDGPESILLESMLEGLAEYYSVALAENVKRGQLGNAMKCKHNGVRTYGYDLGDDGYYRVNEEEAAVVRRMFRMYADGASMPEIAAAMPEARTKMGKPLSVGFISKSLRLEKYRGVYSYGQTRVEGGMPAIVDGELFEGVQGMLAARARRRRSTMEYLLSGKLFDAEGHRYQSSSGHGKSGRKYTYYRCPATGHQVPQHVLEDAVAKAAADVIAADDDAVEAIVAMVMAAQAEEMADSIAAADATRKRLEQNAREQSRVVDLAAKTGAVDAVAAKLGQLADEREELEASLAEMELSCAMVDEERAEFWVRRLMGRSDPLEAVRLFVDRVVLDREAGEMRVAFSFDGIKKNPHQAESDGGSCNCRLAEEVGFEPTEPCGSTVFKTAAFNHSAIPPYRLVGYHIMMLMNDEEYMRMALEEAQRAAAMGEVPIGAVVVYHPIDKATRRPLAEPRVIARACNIRETQQDPAGHAEFVAMKAAAAELGVWRLTGCTVYVTLEPCIMCAGLMHQARVDRCVFGAPDPKAGALGTLYSIHEDKRLNHTFDVKAGVLSEECATILRDFFKARRKKRTEQQ